MRLVNTDHDIIIRWRGLCQEHFCYHCVKHIKLYNCTKFHDHRGENNEVTEGPKKAHDE